VALSHRVFQRYTFVDYATQLYSAAVALAIALFHSGTVPHWRWLIAAHLTGLMTVHWLVARPHWLPRELGMASRKALAFFRHFYPVLIYIWFYAETGWLNRMFFRTYLDPAVIRMDQALFGYQPSILWMQKLPYLAVSEVFYAAYFSYYPMIFGVGLALYLRNRGQFFHYISIISFVFYICYAFYIAVPVIGPPVLFQTVPGYILPADIQALAPQAGFPEAVQRGIFYQIMKWIYDVFEAPGAAIPSSHVAIALCIVSFCFRYLRAVRYPILVVSVLLCLSTVYCRYHYATDVLAGIVTAAVLVPLGNRLYFKLEKRELIGEAVRSSTNSAKTRLV
jgi:membrane-associated phospholipid phosphatase